MADEVTPQQALFLLRLSFEPNGAQPSAIYPGFTRAAREKLKGAGLITVGKRPKGAGWWATLTERGWLWIEEHLDAPLAKAQASGVVLSKLLSVVKAQIAAGKVSYADFVRPSPANEWSVETPTEETKIESASTAMPSDVRSYLIAACRELSGDGVYNVRIRLRDLRDKLPEVPRNRIDETLMQMEREQAVALMPLDDPRELQPADDAAALANSVGQKRHILYLPQPR